VGRPALARYDDGAMCDICKILQLQIDRYKCVLKFGFDPLTEQRLKDAISELERRKAELHRQAG
jgi:hypothetical protein